MAEYKDVTLIMQEIEQGKHNLKFKNAEYAEVFASALAFVQGVIDRVPVVDVVEVRHGYWVKEKPGVLIHWHCSVCENCYFLEEPNAKYCPHCGAKMDGEGVRE